MAGKENAVALFEQGVWPGDAELAALGLKPTTVRKYYRRWLAQNPTAPAPVAVAEAEPEPVAAEPVAEVLPIGVPVGNLVPGTEFESSGNRYRLIKVDMDTAQAKVMFREWAPSGDTRVDKYSHMMPLDELVSPA